MILFAFFFIAVNYYGQASMSPAYPTWHACTEARHARETVHFMNGYTPRAIALSECFLIRE